MATIAPLVAANGGAAAAVNKKKAKRRAKEAAKKERERAAQVEQPQGSLQAGNGLALEKDIPYDAEYHDAGYHYDAADGDEVYYSDAAQAEYASPNGLYSEEYAGGQSTSKARKKGKKGSAGASSTVNGLGGRGPHANPNRSNAPPLVSSLSSNGPRSAHRSNSRDRIWNTSTQEERERIKEFWLNLDENERKSLVKIEKEAVLRKMKEQQKHSCSCTVCGRKRTAIEEELEVLYDAYYEELEQYAYHWHEHENGVSGLFAEDSYSRLGRLPPDRMPPLVNPHQPTPDRLRELPGQEYEDEEDDELYDSQDVEDYSDGTEEDEEPLEIPRGPAADFFNFGNSLTVKGSFILQSLSFSLRISTHIL